MEQVVLKTDLKGIKRFSTGKVRDIYDLGDRLLFVATDRISAFDVVLPTGIPYKGKVLNGLSDFWFNFTKEIIGNHFVTSNLANYPEELKEYGELLSGRSMIVKKAQRIGIECVVRAYLSGSAWKSYRESGIVCGIKLPSGLRESDKLPEPMFTPTFKSDTGHDVEMTMSDVQDMVGAEIAQLLKEKSLEILSVAGKYVESKGLILADTKFEFGIYDGQLILIDEILTPDSSRFWSLEEYEPGRPQKSFDKQFVRDYLEQIGWDKTPPAPSLPEDVVTKTTEKYLEAYRRI